MRELTVFVGGSVGSEPYSVGTWSGSSRFFLKALDDNAVLDKAVGVELATMQKYWLLLRNFSRKRAVWRSQFYLDPKYREAMTIAAGKLPVDSPACLQIGAMFSLSDVFPGKNCFSYHDGNLAQSVNSGFGLTHVSPKRIDKALRYEERCAQQMTNIFTFSKYLRESFIKDYRVPAEKVISIGGGVNLIDVAPSPTEHDYAAQKLLFVGIDFARKGGRQLLEAFKIVRQTFPAATLHIVGPRTIPEAPSGVVFHGKLSKEDPAQRLQLTSLFQGSSFFVMPSLYEPFGIATLEAMLYGLPCLVTDGWALREQVRPGINGDLVEKGSVEDLASKIRLMLADPGRLRVMGAEAHRIAAEEYTWDVVAKRLLPHLSKR